MAEESSHFGYDIRMFFLYHNILDENHRVLARADDSYFSFAESFVQNGLPLRSLNEALHLGRLGTQTVLISEKSFRNLTFDGADFADKTVYYPKFIARDSNVRETYRREIRNRHSYKNDIFVLDILREEMKDNDSRIQRILSI